VFHDEVASYDPTQDVPGQSIHGTTVLSVIAGYAPGRIIGPAYRADYLLAKTERIGSETRVEEDAWCEAIEWAESVGADIAASSLSYYLWYSPEDRDGRTALVPDFRTFTLKGGFWSLKRGGKPGRGERRLKP